MKPTYEELEARLRALEAEKAQHWIDTIMRVKTWAELSPREPPSMVFREGPELAMARLIQDEWMRISRNERTIRKQRTPIYEDDEFQKALLEINALYVGDGWKAVRSRKEHLDDFSVPIESEEVYYSRTYGSHWTHSFKLSRQSMDVFIALILLDNRFADKVCDMLLEIRRKESW